MAVPSWKAARHAEEARDIRVAGASLFSHLLTLFAERRVSAKDFCIACHWAAQANVPGADWSSYSVAPGQTSDGNYQKHLDTIIPPHSPTYVLEVPCNLRGTGLRETIGIHSTPLA